MPRGLWPNFRGCRDKLGNRISFARQLNATAVLAQSVARSDGGLAAFSNAGDRAIHNFFGNQGQPSQEQPRPVHGSPAMEIVQAVTESVRQLRHYFGTISHAFLSPTPPYIRRVPCAAWCPGLVQGLPGR